MSEEVRQQLRSLSTHRRSRLSYPAVQKQVSLEHQRAKRAAMNSSPVHFTCRNEVLLLFLPSDHGPGARIPVETDQRSAAGLGTHTSLEEDRRP